MANSGSDEPPDGTAPERATVDEVRPQRSTDLAIDAGAVGQALRRAVREMHTVHGEHGYGLALAELRSSGEDAVRSIATTFDRTDPTEYLHRWTLTKLLADVGHPSAVDHLLRMATADLPQPETLTIATASRDGVIRTTAVEGIAAQARAGNTAAISALREAVTSPLFSVRQAAAAAYLEVAGDGARADLETVLPEGERFVLDIRSVTPPDLSVAAPVSAARNHAGRAGVPPPASGEPESPVPPSDDAPTR